VKKRGAKKNAASIARGHVRALAKRGIKIDKRGRARKDGKPLAKTKLERAVYAIERSRRPPPSKRGGPPAKATKSATKAAAKPKRPTKPKELSERDAFILESLEKNHLTPEVRKRYIKNLSSRARKMVGKGSPGKISQQDAFILQSLEKNHLTPEVRKRYIKNLSPQARTMVKEVEERESTEDPWRRAEVLLRQAIRNKSLYMEWEVIAEVLKLPPQEVFEYGLTLAGAKPSTLKAAWQNWQRAEQLIREALARGTFQGEYERIAAATGLPAREIYSLGISPPSLGTAA
jgi:hypothetical protein